MDNDKKIIPFTSGSKRKDENPEEYVDEAMNLIKEELAEKMAKKLPSASPRRKKSGVVQTATGNGNTQVAGDYNQHIHGEPQIKLIVPPPDDTIGGDSMLRDRIQTLFDELRMRRKERFGNTGFSVATSHFKKYFKIPPKKNWNCIWLWKKSRADEIIQYLDGKLKNTIQGRIEGAAARPGYRHTRGQLFARERKILDELDLTSDSPKVRDWMQDYFGVTSRRDMTDDQLANWVAFLDEIAAKL
jgi:hypothetical protein